MDQRSQAIAKLTRLMKQDDGWTLLFPPQVGVAKAYAEFKESLRRLSRSERRRARDGLLLELAATLVDKAHENGFSYAEILADLGKVEKGLNG